MMPFLFEIPTKFADPLVYERIGAMIHERASGNIVGHIQELGGWGLLSKMPIPGGNPLGLVSEAVQMGQLHGIQQTLNAVQSLATVGAVASVATLGVSVVGFAAVLSKLKRIDGKLDRALSELAQIRKLVESLNIKADALQIAELRQGLEAVALARNYSESRRNTDLTVAVNNLAKLRHYYGGLLANPQFCAFGTVSIGVLHDVQERLVAACEGELFADLLLGSSPKAIAERWLKQKEVFNAIAWTTPKSLYQLAEQGDRDSGVYMVVHPQERSDKVSALSDIRNESIARLASLPVLAQFLCDRGVSGEHYLQLLEEQAHTGQSLVVICPR
jgi:hypothetical protein